MLGKERNKEMEDQQFTDFAWSEMSNMLDREMPVTPAPKKGKRYGLLLLVLLIGFVAGIGTMFFVQRGVVAPTIQPAIPQAPRKMAKEKVVAKAEQSLMTAETDQLLAVQKSNQQIENKIQNTLTKSATPSAPKNVNLYDQNVYTNSSSVIVFNESPENKLKDHFIDPSSRLNTNRLANVQSTKAEEVNNQIDNQKDVYPNSLAFLKHSSIPFIAVPQKGVELEIQMPRPAPKLNFGFYMGTQTRDFKGMHGLSTGIYARYGLDDKFSLRTGLGYSVITGFQSKSIGINEPLTPDYFEPIEINVQDYSSVTPLVNNQDLPLQNLQYLDLPVALDYRMSGKLSIIMGMKFSYLLNAKTSGNVSQNLNDRDIKLLDDALYNSMRKMDVATVFGFSVYPSSKVGLELKYNHGLIDYTIDQNWHIRQLNTNKTFELSMNYFLR